LPLILAAALIIALFSGCIYDQIFWVLNDTHLMFLTCVPSEDTDDEKWVIALANVATQEVSEVSFVNADFNAARIAPSNDAKYICLVPDNVDNMRLEVFRQNGDRYKPH
jgi:hypothetical protein